MITSQQQASPIPCALPRVQAFSPNCGTASRDLYYELRRRYYLVPNGLPFFSPGWRLKTPTPISHAEMYNVPGDWVVVLARRPGQSRMLNNGDEVHAVMGRLFGRDRVVSFPGSKDLQQGEHSSTLAQSTVQ